MKGPRQHPGNRYQVAERGKSLAGDQQMVMSPLFHFNPPEVAVPVFLSLSQCLPAVKRLGLGIVQKLALDK